MAKTGINFERCNVTSAEVHNTRNAAYIAAVNSSPKKKYDIFEDETKNNVSWVNPDYERKTLRELLDELRALYKEKVGQAPQETDRTRTVTDKKTGMKKEVTVAGWSPIREGVCPIKEDTTIEDFRPFIKWLGAQGVHVVRIDLHHDEGYTDLVTGERRHNHHAHIVADWVNHETGKTAKLNNLDASEMQTQIALSLGMERGESKTATGKEHLSADRQRAKAEAEELARVRAKAEELEKQVEDCTQTVRTAFGDLVEFGKLTVANFDKITDNEGAVPPTQEERDNRDYLEQECGRDYEGYTIAKLGVETKLLHLYIERTQAAIRRIGTKIQVIAANVPKLSLFSGRQRQLLAREAEMEKKVESAQSDAQRAIESAENALKTAVSEADNAKAAAKEKEEAAKKEKKKYEELNAGLEQKIADARESAKKEGIHLQHQKWLKWKNNTHTPVVQERDALRTEVSNLETELANTKQVLSNTREEFTEFRQNAMEQAVKTAKTLIRMWGAAAFENAELDYDITEFGSWQTAKKELQKELRNERSRGVKMG